MAEVNEGGEGSLRHVGILPLPPTILPCSVPFSSRQELTPTTRSNIHILTLELCECRLGVLAHLPHFALEIVLLSTEPYLVSISLDLKLLTALLVQQLPLSTNFFHDLEGRHFRVLSLDAFACLPHKDHICAQTLLWSCSFDFLEEILIFSDRPECFHFSLVAQLVCGIKSSPWADTFS